MAEKTHLPESAALPAEASSVLVFAALPGDDLLGCGGTAALHVGQGVPVRVVVLSGEGTAVDDAPSREYWALSDEQLLYGEALVARIGAAIEESAADLIYLPWHQDERPERRVLAMAVVAAVRRSGRGRLCFYEIGEVIGDPDRWVDVTGVMEDKRAAMAALDTPSAEAMGQRVEALNRYRATALSNDTRYAEAFIVAAADDLASIRPSNFLSAGHPAADYGLVADPAQWPLVSILVRSVDRDTLDQALGSVALQTYPSVEVVVVNAKGADHRPLADRCGRFPLRFVDSEASLHRSLAANRAIEAANGVYCNFLDDDDWLDASHVASLVDALRGREGVGAVYSSIRTVHESGEEGQVFDVPFDPVTLFSGNYIPIHSVLFDRELATAAGCRFDPGMDVYEDWDFWLQLSRHTRFEHLEEVTASYRITESGGFGVNADEDLRAEGESRLYRKWHGLCDEACWSMLMKRVNQFHGLRLQRNHLSGDNRQLREVLEQRGRHEEELGRQVDELSRHSERLARRVAELDGAEREATELRSALVRRGEALELRELDLHHSELRVAHFDSELKAALVHINNLQAMLVRKDAEIGGLAGELERGAHEIARLRQRIEAIVNSSSWELTAPLRVFGRVLKRLLRRLSGGGRVTPAAAEPALEVVAEAASAAAEVEERSVVGEASGEDEMAFEPPEEEGSESEAPESEAEEAPVVLPPSPGAEVYRQLADQSAPAPSVFRPADDHFVEADDCDVRLIAFYLPQFHPIPENDAWWGKGFTEWTNVSKALPQFLGHYQPRLPGELGYYDLRVSEVIGRQIELARQYGIQGFCMYYYWFNGRRLLEGPLDAFVANPDFDFPFCVCWANENWTRRWDGMESEVLIAQRYSEDDDQDFIESVIPLMRDSRYIRINGKPLLMVYRPGLFPDAAKTAERWRDACREQGIGEILLVMAQCFNDLDPRPYGFDVAVEFPPHHVDTGPGGLTNIRAQLTRVDDEYSGHVFDYGMLLDREHLLDVPDYPLFKAVFPGWDNSARRGHEASIFHRSTPTLYRSWLSECCHVAKERTVEGESVVFINAWNEWAEGAYLEPDRHYGYAYLAATREVMAEFSRRRAKRLEETRRVEKSADIAVVLHLYYPELWWEVIHRLKGMGRDFDLYVSLGAYSDESVIREILIDFPDARLFQFANIGRDVLPFLHIFRDIEPLGYRWICKLHSKKSPHRDDGDQWRRENLDGLLGSAEVVDRIIGALSSGAAGIVAAPGQILGGEQYWRSNVEKVFDLLSEAAIDPDGQSLDFVAGTMFWCVPEAISSVLALSVEGRFEPEKGQVDGTLAHAIERYLSIAARANGFKVVEYGEIAADDPSGADQPEASDDD